MGSKTKERAKQRDTRNSLAVLLAGVFLLGFIRQPHQITAKTSLPVVDPTNQTVALQTAANLARETISKNEKPSIVEPPYLQLPVSSDPIPLVNSTSLEEEIIQEDLKRGAVILPLGIAFGEPGNVVVTAHSSGISSFGPYSNAFANLTKLAEGHIYTITTTHATYIYKVTGRDIVWPHQVDALPKGERSTVTLVTCWPLWTNLQRLLIHSELINIEYSV